MKAIRTLSGLVCAAIIISGAGISGAGEMSYQSTIQVKDASKAEYAGMAKISLNAAVNAARKQIPGEVLRAELENENGSLVYGVEIASPDHSTVDVKIDAGNGKILKTAQDQNDNQNQEKEDSGNDNEERD